MNRVLWVRWLRWMGWLAAVVCGVSAATAWGMAADIRVLVWDERQPQQKQAYSNWLGNGHETYPVFQDPNVLKVVENAVVWLGAR